MQILPVIVPYIKTTSNIAISCKSLRDWLSNNGFPIKSSKGDLCPETYDFYKLLDYPKLDQWTIDTLSYAFNDCDRLLSLLEKGVNINARDSKGCTAVIWAALDDYPECLKILLEAGADPEVKSEFGNTALILASWKGNANCLQLLLGSKANIEAKNRHTGYTSLIEAGLQGNTDCIKILLKSGAKIDLWMRKKYPEYSELWSDSTL